MRNEITVKALKAAGGVTALARLLGIKQPSVTRWSRIPPERCLAVEEITGVSRYDLRPDVYGPKP